MSLRRSRTATPNTEIKTKRGAINLRKPAQPAPQTEEPVVPEIPREPTGFERLQSIALEGAIPSEHIARGTASGTSPTQRAAPYHASYRTGIYDDDESRAAFAHMNLQMPNPPGGITQVQLTPYRNFDMDGVDVSYRSVADETQYRSTVRMHDGSQFSVEGFIARGDVSPGLAGLTFQAALRVGAARANQVIQERFPNCFYRISIPMVSPEGSPVIISVMEARASGPFVIAVDLRNLHIFPPIMQRRPREPIQDLIADMVVLIFRHHCPGMGRYGV